MVRIWECVGAAACRRHGLPAREPRQIRLRGLAAQPLSPPPATPAPAEATLRSLTLGTVASQSVGNLASKASFTVDASVTVGGAFLTTSSTKGGTTGVLVAGEAFSGGVRALLNGDTLLVSVTLTAASA